MSLKWKDIQDYYKPDFNDSPFITPTASPVSDDLNKVEGLFGSKKKDECRSVTIKQKEANEENIQLVYKKALTEANKENQFLRKALEDMQKEVFKLKREAQEKDETIWELVNLINNYGDQ